MVSDYFDFSANELPGVYPNSHANSRNLVGKDTKNRIGFLHAWCPGDSEACIGAGGLYAFSLA
jgi:hypothetical protein